MSKAKFKCYPTRMAPRADSFQQRAPESAVERNERLRSISQKLGSSGRNLADATPKNPPIQQRDRTP